MRSLLVSLALVTGCAEAIDDVGGTVRSDAGGDLAPGADTLVGDTFVAREDTATEEDTTTIVEDTGSVPTDTGPCGLTVNELQTGDGTTGGTADFVELYNSCAAARSIANFKLVYRSSSGTTDVIVWTFPSGTTIGGRGYVVIGGSGFSGSKDGTLSSGLSVGGGAIGLRDASEGLVDSVGYGNATNAFVEGSVAPAPGDVSPAKSIGRKPNGADSDNNASDFVVSDSTPGAPN